MKPQRVLGGKQVLSSAFFEILDASQKGLGARVLTFVVILLLLITSHFKKNK